MASADISMPAEMGTASQLPYGAATDLNEVAPTTDVTEPEAVTAPEAGGEESLDTEEALVPELATPADYEPQYTPTSEDDDFIVGPSTRPDEPVTAGAAMRPRLSSSTLASLPVLVAAAAEPDASEELQALVAILLREANR